MLGGKLNTLLAVVEQLSETLPDAVTSGGATMTPLAAFGGHGALYLMLEVEAPEGTVLPALGEDETYWLSSNDNPETQRMGLETAEGQRRQAEDEVLRLEGAVSHLESLLRAAPTTRSPWWWTSPPTEI